MFRFSLPLRQTRVKDVEVAGGSYPQIHCAFENVCGSLAQANEKSAFFVGKGGTKHSKSLVYRELRSKSQERDLNRSPMLFWWEGRGGEGRGGEGGHWG